MKIWNLLFLIMFLPFQVFACCMSDHVSVYPREGSITRNPVFLIEYDEGDFKLADKLDELEFFLLVNKKRKVKVELLERVTGIGAHSQLLLKPAALLKLDDSVQLQVQKKNARPDQVDEQFEIFRARINGRKWLVNLKKDREPVTWAGKLSWEYSATVGGSIVSRDVLFYFQVADSNPFSYEYWPGRQSNQQLFEVEIEGRKFFCIGGGAKNYFSIYDSECGGNFRLQRKTSYEASITALDFSGNRSTESQRIAFNTFSPKKR